MSSARLVGTFFVRRHWRQARLQRDALARRLGLGESFVLFAEGTSGDGLSVLPFKTSLLGVAEPGLPARAAAVQPVTLAFARLGDGSPVTAGNCALYAWHGDAAFVPHFLQVLQMGGVEVHVVLHAPVPACQVRCRKLLGRRLRQRIGAGLEAVRRSPPEADEVPAGEPRLVPRHGT